MRKKIISLLLAGILLCPTGIWSAGAADSIDPELAPPTEQVTEQDTPPTITVAAETKTAKVSTMELTLDGNKVTPAGYLIGNYTYFKLRDIAYLMRDKLCSFSVDYDSAKRRIVLATGEDYEADGTELKKTDGGNQVAVESALPVIIDGKTVTMSAYIINDFTYYKLRDIGDNLGFDVGYANESRTGIMKTPGYVEPETPTPTSEPEPEPMPEPEPEPTPETRVDGQLTIMIDVGHGGSDSGSDGIASMDYVNYKGQSVPAGSKIYEKDFNLPVALYLRDMLEKAGVTVIMTRDSDVTLTASARQKLIVANASKLDLCFSVHHNAYNAQASGYEILAQVQYQNGGAGKDLAALIDSEYAALGRTRHRPTVFREGSNGDYYFMLRYPANEGVLALISEYCFIDNAVDQQSVLSDAGMRSEAEAMYRGIMSYFQTHEY